MIQILNFHVEPNSYIGTVKKSNTKVILVLIN